jgi:RNA polymerase sigma factor (sigma-70 family)
LSDDDAFYRSYVAPIETRILRTVFRVRHGPDAARDALQDALLRVWQHRDEVRTHPNPEALIVRIAYHAAIDAWRRERRAPLAGADAPENHADATSRDPLSTLEGKETREAVLEAVAGLPHQQALGVLLRVVEEEPYAVVAQALGCSEITARIHVMRGRSKLARLLAHLAPAPANSGGGR